MDDPVVVRAPSGPSEHGDGWRGIDGGFTAGFTKGLGLREAAVVASATSKIRQKASEGRQEYRRSGQPILVQAGHVTHCIGQCGIEGGIEGGREKGQGVVRLAVRRSINRAEAHTPEFMKVRSPKIATLRQKHKSRSGKSRSVRAGEIRVPSEHGSLESILVQQARVRVRDKRLKKRQASVTSASDKKKHEKKVNLTLRMMLGVRVSVGRQAAEAGREELQEEDFNLVDEYDFPPAGTAGRLATPSHQLNKTFKFKDYAPKAFKNLRKMFGIEELPYTLSVAGNYDYLELITNSKSGSFFFFSHNLKYIIKSMKKSEAKFFRRILPKYYEHHRRNPDAFLVRFCGMYMVKCDGKKIPFLVMTCIDGMALDKIHRKYDLKGSSWHRKAKEGDKVLKDNNLREADGKFNFGSQREAILKALQADAEFLRDVNVMDYSVFMSVHDPSLVKEPSDRRQLLQREYSNFFVFSDDEPAFVPLPSSRSSMEMLTEDEDDQGDEKKADEITIPEEGQPKPAALPRHIRVRPDGGIEPEGDGPREVYWMGIIDVLTEFTFLRQLEAWYKSILQDGSTVSCVEPGLYCERFVNFMAERTE